MNDRRMTVHEVADLTGITIRTLHYYDEIGLLKPAMVTDSKYRLYTDDDLSRLQQYISESFYKCDNQILLYLGQLYISDERFSNYINGFSNGNLASFFSEAINIFCAKNKE